MCTCTRVLSDVSVLYLLRYEGGGVYEHTEHVELDLLFASASTDRASYVYVMRRRSWTVMHIVDIFADLNLECFSLDGKVLSSFRDGKKWSRRCLYAGHYRMDDHLHIYPTSSPVSH